MAERITESWIRVARWAAIPRHVGKLWEALHTTMASDSPEPPRSRAGPGYAFSVSV